MIRAFIRGVLWASIMLPLAHALGVPITWGLVLWLPIGAFVLSLIDSVMACYPGRKP